MCDMSNDAKQVLTSEQVNDQAPVGWREVQGMLRTRLTTDGYQSAVELVNKIAAVADEAGHHPDLDLRYNWVGVRLVSHDVGGITSRDIELAGLISRLAEDLGAQHAPEVGAALSIGIDTADAAAIIPFWSALTGHAQAKGGDHVLPSPDGQLPEIWFQDSEQRPGRGRVHLDLYVPHDVARERVDAAIAAGGRLVSDGFSPSWWVLADTDGNEACVCTWQSREA